MYLAHVHTYLWYDMRALFRPSNRSCVSSCVCVQTCERNRHTHDAILSHTCCFYTRIAHTPSPHHHFGALAQLWRRAKPNGASTQRSRTNKHTHSRTANIPPQFRSVRESFRSRRLHSLGVRTLFRVQFSRHRKAANCRRQMCGATCIQFERVMIAVCQQSSQRCLLRAW